MGYVMFTTFALLDSALYAIVRPGVIPSRDLAACLIGALFVAIVTKITDRGNNIYSNEKSRRFTIAFQILSSLEVIGTILLPWILIVREYYFESGRRSDIVVPHLFLFQAQIALEDLVMAKKNAGLLFTYTCLANAYRIVPLLSGVQQSRNLMNDKHWNVGTAEILQIIAVILWVISSFIFIPFVWYPELNKPQKTSGTSKEKSH